MPRANILDRNILGF